METYHLLGYHDDGLDGKLPVAVVEQVLQAGAEQVDDQDVMETFLAEVINIRDPGYDNVSQGSKSKTTVDGYAEARLSGHPSMAK